MEETLQRLEDQYPNAPGGAAKRSLEGQHFSEITCRFLFSENRRDNWYNGAAFHGGLVGPLPSSNSCQGSALSHNFPTSTPTSLKCQIYTGPAIPLQIVLQILLRRVTP
jgi:hypothetical protein